MLFGSPGFFVFFAVYFLFHRLIPNRFRVYLIICGSTVFYAWWRPEYAPLPYILMAIAYSGVWWIEGAQTARGRRWRAGATVVTLFVPLAVFKYTNFIYADVLGSLFGWHGRLLDFPLPLGISFVTFTLTAFVVDSYRGRFPFKQRARTVLAYVLFFPHLIAGPILRPHELIPQLDDPWHRHVRRFSVPVAIFTLGLFKKLVFADQIAGFVDSAYGSIGTASGPAALLAIYGFSLQIYCDFSGYTDMAIGLAQLLGFRLPNNFRQPYTARSLVEFWRRWHITLSFWLRDYLYLPLGGNRGGYLRETRNLLIVMVLGGLWHGANWTFVIWGFLHGAGVAFVHLIGRIPALSRLSGVSNWLALALTFHFVTLAWVFFRAPTLASAGSMLARPLIGDWSEVDTFVATSAFPLCLIAIFFCLHRFDDHRRIKAIVRSARPEILWPVIALCWILAITVSQGSSAQFIYFEF